MPMGSVTRSHRTIGLYLVYQFLNTLLLIHAQNPPTNSSSLLTLPRGSGIAVRYEPGTPSPVPGAVPLPSAKINPSDYPPPDKIPPIDSPVVQDWLKKIDMTKIPPVKPTGLEGCNNQTFNPDQIAKAGKDGNCWWSCGGCTRDDDVTVCPNKGTWGASFDDGPSEFTPSLLSYLKKENLKATFFIVGSRAIAHPVLLQTEYMESHQLCIHTWSHPSLTTLTNEQVVAEIAWSMKAFKDIIGVTPNCFRPPYGDVDDRVRYIIRSMGLTNYIWTTGPSGSFDTEDWRVVAKQVTVEETVSQWKKILSAQSNLQSGFIVLAHDLFAEAVALSINSFLPAARSIPNLKVEPISTCLGQDSKQNFFETANQGTVKVPKGVSNSTVASKVENSTISQTKNSTSVGIPLRANTTNHDLMKNQTIPTGRNSVELGKNSTELKKGNPASQKTSSGTLTHPKLNGLNLVLFNISFITFLIARWL